MASFSVVTLVNEDAATIGRFARYYAALGAEKVMVFTDGPAPQLAAPAPPGLQLAECDAAFWAALPGGRPNSLEAAQSAIFGLGHARCASDWLLVVDGDEFLFGNAPLGPALDAVPAQVASVRIATAEAVWGPDDGDRQSAFAARCFRLPTARDHKALHRLLYGSAAPLFRRGLAGHAQGKQLVRRGAALDEIRNHTSLSGGRPITVQAADIGVLDGFRLGHFDAVSPAHWARKWQRRLVGTTHAARMSRRRRRQMDLIGQAARAGTLDRLFARLYTLNRAQYAALRALGLAVRRDIFAGIELPDQPGGGG